MRITFDTAKSIDRCAGDGSGWWNNVADEVRDVIAARSLSDAAAVIAWWTEVPDTARDAAKRIREAARALHLNA